MFVVDALTTLIAGAVLALTRWRSSTGGRLAMSEVSESLALERSLLRDPRLTIFLCASILVGIVFFQHESALPLYMVQYLHLSPAFYGTLFTVNTLLIVALEVPLNTATSHWPNSWALFAGSMLFAIGFGALTLVSSPLGILLLTVVWTFGEMMLFPAMSVHLGEIAPERHRGSYMGLYSMSLSVALTLGPWLGVQLLAGAGPVGVWSVMFVLGALAAVLMVYAAPQVRSAPAADAAGS
jgi:predicted MFS family arabinose efflux permease